MEELIPWIMGGFAAFLMFILAIVFRLSTQTAVLQKTVDTMVTRLDNFLAEEIKVLKSIAAKL